MAYTVTWRVKMGRRPYVFQLRVHTVNLRQSLITITLFTLLEEMAYLDCIQSWWVFARKTLPKQSLCSGPFVNISCFSGSTKSWWPSNTQKLVWSCSLLAPLQLFSYRTFKRGDQISVCRDQRSITLLFVTRPLWRIRSTTFLLLRLCHFVRT